jgi:hypothetical protein
MKLRHGEKSVALKWMTPRGFLMECPHPAMPKHPAALGLYQKGKGFSQSSIKFLKKSMKKGTKTAPLYLNFKQRFRGYPSHEGRHRAFVSTLLGFKKVPVIVVK